MQSRHDPAALSAWDGAVKNQIRSVIKVSGFASGDIIGIGFDVTGVTYKQTSNSVATRTLTKGCKADGMLTLAAITTAACSIFTSTATAAPRSRRR